MDKNNFLGNMTPTRQHVINKRLLRRANHKDLVSKWRNKKFPVIDKNGNFKETIGWNIIKAPEDFTLESNESREFLSKLKEVAFTNRKKKMTSVDYKNGSEGHILLDMFNLKNISIDASVVLAAEIMRCERLLQYKIRGRFPESIDIRLILKSLGFFELVSTDDPCPNMQLTLKDTITIQTIMAMTTEINGRDSTRKALQSLNKLIFGDSNVNNALTKKLRELLAEILINIAYHAYENKEGGTFLDKTLWFSGYKDTVKGKFVFMVYDQGVGIPKSLHFKKKWISLMKEFINKQDAETIDYATGLGKSSSTEEGRGNGLYAMKQITEKYKGSKLTIHSSHGLYVYNPSNEQSQTYKENLKEPLEGTLLMWELMDVDDIKVKLEGIKQDAA